MRERVGGRPQRVRCDPFIEPGRDDVRDPLPDEILTVVPELLLCLQVQQHDLARYVDDDHRVGRRLEEPAVLRTDLVARAQIVTELGEPADLSIGSIQRRERHARQEPRAVLAHPHPGLFVPAVGRGQAKDLGGPSTSDFVGREEAREVTADDLIRRVPLYPFSTRVPSLDGAVRPDDEDGVVADAVDERAIPGFALLEGCVV